MTGTAAVPGPLVPPVLVPPVLRPTEHAAGSRVLSEEECVERLALATIGRVGFVTAQGLQIIPVSVRSSGTSLMLDTTPNSSLAQLAEMGREVTLEVDESTLSTGQAWSVLMQGPIRKLDRQGRARRDAMSRAVQPWPGDSASLALEFTPRSYSGRLVQHEPPTGSTGLPQAHRQLLGDGGVSS